MIDPSERSWRHLDVAGVMCTMNTARAPGASAARRAERARPAFGADIFRPLGARGQGVMGSDRTARVQFAERLRRKLRPPAPAKPAALEAGISARGVKV